MKNKKKSAVVLAGAMLIGIQAMAQSALPAPTPEAGASPAVVAAPAAAAAPALAATPVASASTATSAADMPQPDRAGIFKSVAGDVSVVNAAGASRSARPGDAVDSSEQVITAAGAGAALVLRDGTTLVVGPSSQLNLKEYRFDSTTQDGGLLLSLLRGSMRMVTGLLGKKHPDAVRVETQTATIGIRGTDFIVTENGHL